MSKIRQCEDVVSTPKEVEVPVEVPVVKPKKTKK